MLYFVNTLNSFWVLAWFVGLSCVKYGQAWQQVGVMEKLCAVIMHGLLTMLCLGFVVLLRFAEAFCFGGFGV